MCLMCLMLLVLLDCIFSLPLWFSLMFINIPLFTILLCAPLVFSKFISKPLSKILPGGFAVVDVVIYNSTGLTFGFL